MEEFEWDRGLMIGRGSYGCVNLVTPRSSDFSLPAMVAKWALVFEASSIMREKTILEELQGCPQIVRSFGPARITYEGGFPAYNLLLEYVSHGSLADWIENNPGRHLQESHVRRYTKSILLGLRHIHKKGYVHRDIKPQNILVACPKSFHVKIADFGLALKAGSNEEKSKKELRGTYYYMAPESVARYEYKPSADIWALGCSVVAMLTGKGPWPSVEDEYDLLIKIGFTDELPEIPQNMSEEGKDFLMKCFARDPSKRWTAQMLLEHPFVTDEMKFADYDEVTSLGDCAVESSSFIPLPPDTMSWEDSSKEGKFATRSSFIPLPATSLLSLSSSSSSLSQIKSIDCKPLLLMANYLR